MDYPISDFELVEVSEHDKEVMEADSKILHISFVNFEDIKKYLSDQNGSSYFNLQGSSTPNKIEEIYPFKMAR